MRFQNITDILFFISDNCSCQQHATGLTAYHPGTNHMISDFKIIFCRKMFLNHLTHFYITGHHYIAHLRALFTYIITIIFKNLHSIKISVPGIRKLFLCRSLNSSKGLIESAGLYSVKDWSEMSILRIIYMRQEHGFRASVPYLLRTNIGFFAV